MPDGGDCVCKGKKVRISVVGAGGGMVKAQLVGMELCRKRACKGDRACFCKVRACQWGV